MHIDKKIEMIIDSLIPRGGEKPDSIYVSLEEYLSRLSNLNRKLHGVKYRMECWSTICEEHKIEFDKVLSRDSMKQLEKDKLKITTFSYSSIDLRLENEFEMLLYSLTSTLSALTRVVACFLKGSTQIHSHSKLCDILLKHPGFKRSCSIVANASSSWAKGLTDRRDAATHYIALSVTSSIVHSKSDSLPIKKTVIRIGISKKPVKYVSIWEDVLPTIGGSSHTKISYNNKKETNELMDSKEKIIIRRESPLENPPELIDGEKYMQSLYMDFQVYIKELLHSLTPALAHE